MSGCREHIFVLAVLARTSQTIIKAEQTALQLQALHCGASNPVMQQRQR